MLTCVRSIQFLKLIFKNFKDIKAEIMAFTNNRVGFPTNKYQEDGWFDDSEMTDVCEYAPDQNSPDPGLTDDIMALEQECDRALRRGDEDAADDAVASLQQCQQLMGVVNDVGRDSDEESRYIPYQPPPQCIEQPLRSDDDDIPLELLHRMHTTQAIVVDKSWPSVHSSLAPLPTRNQHRCRTSFPRVSLFRKAKNVEWIKISRKHKIPSYFVLSPSSRIREIKTRNYNNWKERNGKTQSKPKVDRSKINNAIKICTTGEGLEKTKPCHHILQGKPCRFGDKCNFAHTPEELSVKMCAYGDQCKHHKKGTCRYPHTAEELHIATEKARAEMRTQLQTCILCPQPQRPYRRLLPRRHKVLEGTGEGPQ